MVPGSNLGLFQIQFDLKAAGFFTVNDVTMVSINHVIKNRSSLGRNSTALQVFVFDV